MSEISGHNGYDGYQPISWVYVATAPDVPGLILGTICDGSTHPSPLLVLFLQKLNLRIGQSNHVWACLPSYLYDSPEKARARLHGEG